MDVKTRTHGLKRKQTFPEGSLVVPPPGKILKRNIVETPTQKTVDLKSGLSVFVVSESSMIDLCMVKNENEEAFSQDSPEYDFHSALHQSPVSIKVEPEEPDIDSLVEVFGDCSNDESDTEAQTKNRSSFNGQSLHNPAQMPFVRYQMAVQKPVIHSPVIGLKSSHNEIKLANSPKPVQIQKSITPSYAEIKELGLDPKDQVCLPNTSEDKTIHTDQTAPLIVAVLAKPSNLNSSFHDLLKSRAYPAPTIYEKMHKLSNSIEDSRSVTHLERLKIDELCSSKQVEDSEFRLRFSNQTESEPLLKVKHQHALQLGIRPISRMFDLIVRRKNYKSFPIQWTDTDGKIFCPFSIMSAGSVTYMPLSVPKGGDIVHQGARVVVENAEEIMISFMMVSTYLTRDEREKLNIKMHTGKQLELLVLEPKDGTIISSIGFQVVCEPRLGSRKKHVNPSQQSCLDSKQEDDLEEERNNKTVAIQTLRNLIESKSNRLSTRNISLVISLIEALCEKNDDEK